jgi:O-antigen ligase
MLCCGSKLIISLTVLFYAFQFVKKRAYLGYIFIGVIIVSILLFSPTKKRFQEVFDLKSLSVLKENPVPSIRDSRLNGLTLRLIIWQESLNSLKNSRDFFFGKGVDKAADKVLEDRLSQRGLAVGHTKYDPHNQFIATYYKMGFIGFMVLVGICIYYFYLAIRKRSSLLLYSIVLFSAAMFTESVLQRVVGIYFFICILLLLSEPLTNPTQHVENSDTRNEGNS